MTPLRLKRLLLLAALALTALVYWPGLRGTWLFDDFPNIVDNQGVQPKSVTLATMVDATLASPASDFKRPLASLSFALNYIAAGLDPYWMKLTNLGLHLLNGLLVFVLARRLLVVAEPSAGEKRSALAAVLIATGWMLVPINLTAVLYIVQRMESMANLFVLIGLIGHISCRQRMQRSSSERGAYDWKGLALCATSLIVPTALGLMAKETAVMLPLYALAVEWVLFRFRTAEVAPSPAQHDWRVTGLFLLVLVLPMIAGLGYLLPSLMKPESWATRDFTMGTRLLSEARIVLDYLHWTLLPTPHALSFYHDDYVISSGLFQPWTTAASLLALVALFALALAMRARRPLVSLGILLYLGSHLLTATILPLELIYEHRNYFASFGVMLAVIPLLVPDSENKASTRPHTFAMARYALLGGLLALWTVETALTSLAWGDPLLLSETLAERAPSSPRAQYELGRTYIVYSKYEPTSRFTALAQASLEKAASLPGSTILPEQALIFMNARMHLPLKDAWWDSLVRKLKDQNPGVQDESALGSLTQCARSGNCDLPANRMIEAFVAALSHPRHSARLASMYADYGWNVLGDRPLGLRMAEDAVRLNSSEPAYRITLTRMLAASGDSAAAVQQIAILRSMNIGGRLDETLSSLSSLLPSAQTTMPQARTQ